jgi:hypothetical protein
LLHTYFIQWHHVVVHPARMTVNALLLMETKSVFVLMDLMVQNVKVTKTEMKLFYEQVEKILYCRNNFKIQSKNRRKRRKIDTANTIMYFLAWYRHIKNSGIQMIFGSSLSPVVSWRAHVLFTLIVFACVQRCPTHIELCFCFVFVPCLVSPLLSVFLDNVFFISPSVFSNV